MSILVIRLVIEVNLVGQKAWLLVLVARGLSSLQDNFLNVINQMVWINIPLGWDLLLTYLCVRIKLKDSFQFPFFFESIQFLERRWLLMVRDIQGAWADTLDIWNLKFPLLFKSWLRISTYLLPPCVQVSLSVVFAELPYNKILLILRELVLGF